MVARRLRRKHRAEVAVERHPDDLPKTGLFAEPVRVASIKVLDPEEMGDDLRRVTFLVEVRDAEDKRCSDVSVEARVTGPERSRTAHGTTDLLGRIRFRTTGTAGSYRIELRDVAAGGLDWDRDAGPLDAGIELA